MLNNGDTQQTAEIIAELTRPGTNTNPADGFTPDTDTITHTTEPPRRPTEPPADICNPENPTPCRFTGAEPEPPPPGEPALTLQDIAAFHPEPGQHRAEPDGWAILNLPANALADNDTQTRSGTLFDRPVHVRFHPVGYHRTYSDGTTHTTTDPGTTWEDLDQPEFTTTPTSHVYTTPGEHTARLDITYIAEYRYAGSTWRWIDGTLTIPGTPTRILVGELDTVLVTGPCTTHPHTPGCD
ncbi:hypothetical protein [Agromyces marinus]|uniref:PKD domain-containing protein n=1 Tax=Agromyces marinus TaxID=1389020 RepID=A0ABN6YG48_9MICO|nr:hypothetical protein [Agromyces marinus]UIP57471.1 hypothetical protein DSM26151_03320 [Agromyces marinus]BDZ54398.1 hypothetical protein GCM10025870_14710 [Agromyces marinus]